MKSIPKGYKSRAQYISVLRGNLAMCKRTPKLAHFVAHVEAQLKEAGVKS